MKGKIDGNGRLQIERGGLLRTQECPFNPANNWCGDWCPLFGEPKPDGYYDPSADYEQVLTGKTGLGICKNRELLFDGFIDEREGAK